MHSLPQESGRAGIPTQTERLSPGAPGGGTWKVEGNKDRGSEGFQIREAVTVTGRLRDAQGDVSGQRSPREHSQQGRRPSKGMDVGVSVNANVTLREGERLRG